MSQSSTRFTWIKKQLGEPTKEPLEARVEKGEVADDAFFYFGLPACPSATRFVHSDALLATFVHMYTLLRACAALFLLCFVLVCAVSIFLIFFLPRGDIASPLEIPSILGLGQYTLSSK